MDQRDRADKIEPTLAAEAIENAEANEPTDPTDRIEPAEPMERIEPDEPIDRIDPLDAMLRMEPEDPGERDDWAEVRITTFWQAGEQQGLSGWMLARSHIAPGDRAQSGRSRHLVPTERAGRARAHKYFAVREGSTPPSTGSNDGLERGASRHRHCRWRPMD
jgi:hypothetical protein